MMCSTQVSVKYSSRLKKTNRCDHTKQLRGTPEDAASCTFSRPKYTALHARDSDRVLYDAEPSVGSEPERPSNLEIGLTPKALEIGLTPKASSASSSVWIGGFPFICANASHPARPQWTHLLLRGAHLNHPRWKGSLHRGQGHNIHREYAIKKAVPTGNHMVSTEASL